MVAPDARDIRTLSIQGRARVMIRAPKVANGEILRKGGLSPLKKVSPPHPRERKPNWTIATRSVRRGTLKAGRHSGRSRTWSPLCLLPQLFRISGHRGHGRWEVWVHCCTRAYGVCLRVDLPCRRGFGAFMPPGFEPWCDEEGPPP